MKRISLLILALVLSCHTFASPPSAKEIIAAATKKATVEHKTIFVHFGASWCGWCKRLDAFLDSAEVKPVFEKYFVSVKLVVQENAANKALENPGADKLQIQLDGPAGLPYSAFLDARGSLIVNSKQNGNNIGFPAQPEEIDWFMAMVKKAAPSIVDADLKTIEKALRTKKD